MDSRSVVCVADAAVWAAATRSLQSPSAVSTSLTPEAADELAAIEAIYTGEVVARGDTYIELLLHMGDRFTPSLSNAPGTLAFFPVHVRFECAGGYPYDAPPRCEMEAYWADDATLSAATRVVRTLWDENPRCVLYEAIEYLSKEFAIVHEVRDAVAAADPSVAMALVQYNRPLLRAAFDAGLHVCAVCFEEKIGRDFLLLYGCEKARTNINEIYTHIVCCRECLSHMCAEAVAEGNLDAVRCPDRSCQAPIAMSDLRQLLDHDSLVKFESFSVNRAIDLMSDVVWCPRLHCNAPVILDSTDATVGVCAQCTHSFCVQCRLGYHPAISCAEAMVQATAAIGKGKRKNKKSAEEIQWSILQRMRAFQEARLNAVLIASTTRHCPQCKVVIEKNGGCDHMYCTRCRTHFNWSEAPSTRDVAALEDRMTRIAQRKEVERLLREGEASITSCPRCKNYVERKPDHANNHGRCGNCNTRFCMLCHTITDSTSHFGRPNGCAQHGGAVLRPFVRQTLRPRKAGLPETPALDE